MKPIWRESCLKTTVSTKISIWTDLVMNLHLRGERLTRTTAQAVCATCTPDQNVEYKCEGTRRFLSQILIRSQYNNMTDDGVRTVD
jgi:hypothetical protein